MAQLLNLIGSLTTDGIPSLDKFSDLFKKISGGVDALATMIINTQNTLQNDITAQINKVNLEITNLAVANATYITSRAIGKDVSGMPSAESIVKSINTRIQTELTEIMEKGRKAMFKPFEPAKGGGFKTAKTLKNMSVIHRTKTHRRPAIVSKL